jgi:hypothetical protein
MPQAPALHESFTIPLQYIMDSRHMHAFTATDYAFSTLTSFYEHAYTCLHVSTETYQLIWMPSLKLDIYSC